MKHVVFRASWLLFTSTWAPLALLACNSNGVSGASTGSPAHVGDVASGTVNAAVKPEVARADKGGVDGVAYCSMATPNTPGGKALAADAARCSACETQYCGAPDCSAFADDAARAQCNAVIACARQTRCVASSTVDCYCGVGVDVIACRTDPAAAHGACKATIEAGFPAGTAPATIVTELGNVKYPSGNALRRLACDLSYCGLPQFTGHNECVPFCK